MASPGRRADPSLADELFSRPYDFDFFQAIHLLARLFPERKQIGETARPQDETVRLQSRLSMTFPASAVHDLQLCNQIESSPPLMTVAFMGLTGIHGVLPLTYTEWMLTRKLNKDSAAAAFFNLFDHRFLSMFYRAWEKYHPAILYESAFNRDSRPDAFTKCLYDLIGMGTSGLRDRLLTKDENLLFYAGLIAQRPHSAAALRSIVRDFFSVPVEIDQCLGSWYQLEQNDRCYLSENLERNQLGEGAFIGDEVWNQQARFRLRIGPLGADSFRDFLPDRPRMAQFVELTRFIAGQAMAFDVQLLLKHTEVPGCRLTDEGSNAPRLGWMAWLKTEEFLADAGDAVFEYRN